MKHLSNGMECPRAIVAFARHRVDQLSKGPPKSRLRQFLASLATEPERNVSLYARVEKWSECNLEARACCGAVVGRWIITETEVFGYALESDPEDRRYRLQETTWMVQFDFAFSPTGDKCVVVETDLSGNRRRGAYALASGGAQSERLGKIIGDIIQEELRRWAQAPRKP